MSAEQQLGARGRFAIREAVASAVRALVRGGATEDDVATRLGVSVGSVRRWVRDRESPAFTMALRLCPLLGISPETGKRTGAA